LRRLPDKRYSHEERSWFLVVDSRDDKVNRFVKALGKPNSKLSGGGKLWFPTDNDQPQAVFVIDSWPSLLPENTDEKEEKDNSLGVQARAFAQHLPRVRGMLRRKACIIFGVNQLRTAPMVRFGDPTYEPGGSALKFNSSCRVWISERAVPEQWRHDKKVSKYSEEPSVEGNGIDQYQYKHMRNKKNKDGMPYLETMSRIWIKDRLGKGRGFDPAYDTLQFLMTIGLAEWSGTLRTKNSITFVKTKNTPQYPYAGKSMPWLDFKTIIIAEEYGGKAKEVALKLKNKYIKGNDKFNLRKWCFKILRNGEASAFMHTKINADKSLPKKVEDLED
jgi:hypothetical protein